MNSSDSITRSWVFKLIIINCLAYIIQSFEPVFYLYGSLVPKDIIENGKIWQLFTYMFLHDPRNPMHLLFNMYALFIFGITVEDVWGSRKFILYYLFCGVGAGITIFLIGYLKGGVSYMIPTVGASGAVFGLLLAFGVFFPDAEVLLFFFIPMKARTMVIVFGSLELFMELNSGGLDNISHVGHLGGIFFGLVYFALIDRWRSTKRKMKAVVEKIEKPLSAEGSPIRAILADKDEYLEMKKSIMKKISENSLDSITDDEHQFIRYLDIMTDSGKIQRKKGINITDDYVTDHQFLEFVKKHISF
jgi:membrane associated rhomboid family serine protease